MATRSVNAEDLRSGMVLWNWTKAARKLQKNWGVLQEGPDGSWQGMVLANMVQEPRQIDGFGYPPVHKVDVFFWNDSGGVCFHSFFWTAGTQMQVV
jgi:hypothetical protein